MKSYRIPFLILLGLNLLILAGLGAWWWRTHRAAEPAQSGASAEIVAEGPSLNATASAPSASPEASAALTPLAPIQLTPQRLQSIGVEVGQVKWKVIHDDIRVVGNVAVDEREQAYVQTRFSGWIQKVYANANFEYVKKGQPLFTIYSPDLVTTERELLLARQNETLLAKSTVPGVAAGAASLAQAALERLRQYNLPEREIARLETTGQVRQYLEVDSPVSGFITERNALPNLYVEPSTRLYTVANFSQVWVFAEVFQNDLGRVRAGDPATLTVDSYPGRTFWGRVDFVYPEVDMTTRTARVRMLFSNPGLVLKPGMFVNVDLQIPMGRQLVVPASAIFQTGTRSIAFLDRGHGYLQPRDVVAGPQVGNDYIVLKGLRSGDRIVTSANFLIDSESQLQAALGAFAPPPPPAAGTTANAEQAQIAFSSIPSPPRQGENAFEVKLTDAQGKAVAGAQVTLTFVLPPMPEMGMAGKRVEFTLSDKGNGNYEGQGNLPSGGTWQVSIVARRGGQVSATSQQSVDASGGS